MSHSTWLGLLAPHIHYMSYYFSNYKAAQYLNLRQVMLGRWISTNVAIGLDRF